MAQTSPAAAETTSAAAASNTDVDESVAALIAQGKKLQATGLLEQAVDAFADASKLMADKHGPDAAECGDVLFLYGSALYANAVAKLSPLGGGATGSAVQAAAADTEAVVDTIAKDSRRFVFGGDEEDNEDGSKQTQRDSTTASAEAPAADDATPAGDACDEEEDGDNVDEGADDDDDNNDDDGDGDDDQDGSGDEEDAVQQDMQLAWETLDLARLCYHKMGDSGVLKMADVYLALGDVSLEQGEWFGSGCWANAIEDFAKAVEIKTERLKPDDRELAEANYKLALAYEFDKRFDNALECNQRVIAVLEQKLASLKAMEIENGRVRAEIEDIEALLPDILSKVEDIHLQKKEAKEKELESTGTRADKETAGPSTTVAASVNDVTRLVKSKKAAADGGDPNSVNKRKAGADEKPDDAAQQQLRDAQPAAKKARESGDE
ncbi:hypothetical protein HDU84_004613 [Entophlyctis sp. JEL0112]|nr:hypothetical protein HDU84_004613 [Entophlyctis sp. JEL0112]